MNHKIKVLAPRKNPHICYLGKEYAEKISCVKKACGMSLYSILCTCAERQLDTTEKIHEFKKELKANGYKTIGEWAEETIDTLYKEVKSHDNCG